MSREVPEWEYGNTLIPEGDFQEYIEEMVIDCGDVPKDLPAYISNNIDWSGVADDLKCDYGECEYQGNTYLFRY